MKKIFALGVILIAVILSSCTGGSDADTVIDIDALALKLNGQVKFEDQLTLAEERIINVSYSFANASDIAVYTGSGAFAEEIIVAEAEDTEKAKALESELADYLEGKIKRFKSYKPSELSKLDEAILIRRGRYVIYCITADIETASAIIADYK